MDQIRITRRIIHIISRFSNLPSADIDEQLNQQGVYAGKADWAKFIDVFALGVGVAFAVVGVIFFFAFNWHNLHKFVKLGMVQGILIVAVAAVLFTKLSPLIKNILLTGSSVLVGLLFSVFGQIYQTGADAYDFFLGWSVFIALWAIISNFAPLWLLLLALVNTTIVLYTTQVGEYMSATQLCLILLVLNAVVIGVMQLFYNLNIIKTLPSWFSKIVALGAAFTATIGISFGIFEYKEVGLPVAILVTVIIYSAGIYYSLLKRSLYYLCIIPLSVIVIISSFIIHADDNSGSTFFLISAFIIIAITALVRGLIILNKNWNGTSD